MSLDVNTGYTYRTGDGTSAPKTSTFWTCSAGFQISERLTWVAEIFGYPGTTGAVGSRPIVALLTGPTFEIDRSAIVDAGVIFNIEGFGGRAIYAGITWNVGRLWTPAKRPR